MTVCTTLENSVGMLIVSASNAGDLTANIYAGGNNTNVELPYAVCAVESAEELIRGSGIYRCNLVVQVGERAIETDSTSSLCQAVFDVLAQSDIKEHLRALSSSSLFVHNIDVNNLRNTVNTDDKSRVQESSLEVVCSLQ